MFQFKGTYVFKQDGVEIGRSENLITTNGRKVLLQYLAGTKLNWAADMAIGAINTSVSASDVELNFETGRYPVSLKTYISATTTNPDLIVVRATLPASLYANIYEIGLYPETKITNVANRSNRILTDFYDLTNWITSIADQNQSISGQGTTYITAFSPQAASSPRIGGFSVDLNPNTTYSNNTFAFSLQGYSDLDNLQLLVYNTSAGNLTVTLSDSVGNPYTFNYALTTNPGYQVLNAPFPANINFVNTFNSISITTDTTAALTIDAIKTSVSNELTNEDYIISKSILSTPIAKIYGTPLDVEYYVQVL
jgi:hypothetical protein